ncbi:hypothetical protein NPIL_418191 [Nephila pilipes]|uniref:Uncharacterized protein n=1 Tax=Nephila pilipes TaxID=299642 RepID=A0A8X6NLP3_NEPPI|nr:hypothetical protein NPIL_418191 [Nephila pilipes]
MDNKDNLRKSLHLRGLPPEFGLHSHEHGKKTKIPEKTKPIVFLFQDHLRSQGKLMSGEQATTDSFVSSVDAQDILLRYYRERKAGFDSYRVRRQSSDEAAAEEFP